MENEPKRRGRPPDPSKRDENGVLLSRKKWWSERTARMNTYYLSEEDHKLLKRVGKKLKLKSRSEIVRKSLETVDQME